MREISAGYRLNQRPPRGVVQLAAAVLLFASAAHAGMGQILASWPSPKYPNTIRINGIAFEGEYIWIKSVSAESNAVLKCTKTGSLVKEISFPWHGWNDSWGLCLDGAYLWTIHHSPYSTPEDYYVQYTTTGSEVRFFSRVLWSRRYSKSVSWDGQYLWSDDRIFYQQHPDAIQLTTTGTIVASYRMPVIWDTAAAYYNRQLWAGGTDGFVYGMRIGGAVVASFPFPGGSCRAVGFDGEYLWTADANRPQYIYKVDIDVVDVAPASVGGVKALFR